MAPELKGFLCIMLFALLFMMGAVVLAIYKDNADQRHALELKKLELQILMYKSSYPCLEK